MVKAGNFTRAAESAGLTQSAVSRQIQGMEQSLGLALLERTTRTVRPTPAGRFLAGEAQRLIGDVEHSLQHLREQFGSAPKVVRVGVSRSIGFAYLPGFFHANLRRQPQVRCQVASDATPALLAKLDSNDLDLAVLCPPARLPKTLRITHRFSDTFTLIAPTAAAASFAAAKARPARQAWMSAQTWLAFDSTSNTGQLLQAWTARQRWPIAPAMQLDSFDLIMHLVALGLGIGFVPIRALALFDRKRHVSRLALPARFTRELVVVVRRQRQLPDHLRAFVDNVLF